MIFLLANIKYDYVILKMVNHKESHSSGKKIGFTIIPYKKVCFSKVKHRSSHQYC